ncbi:MAG: TrmJ/YjtD family RNA methyltransferase [Candidatus Woesearchaeota archaeon]
MIDIVLMQPENAGNVGAIARVLHNFRYGRLVLIDPKCDIKSSEAIARSKFGNRILANAIIGKKRLLKEYDYIIGTTARLGTDYNLPRSPITPRQLASVIPRKTRIALLFGREGIGLTNKEVQDCDFIVHIPTASKHPTLNISHAVAILLYELRRAESEKQTEEKFVLATKKEKDLLLKLVDKVLGKMKFPTKEKKETQRKVWKRILNKSFLTKREAFALFGFFKRIK